MKWIGLITVTLATLGLTGCGDSADNVAACEGYVQQINSLECYSGAARLDPGSTCGAFDDTDCDISDYFDCLTENTTCMSIGGMSVPDPSGTASCQSLANCN